MNPMLTQLAQCDQPWAAQRAQMALDIAAALESGEMSADEGRALLEDLVNTDALVAESDDAQTRALLVEGVTQVIRLIA